VLAGADAGVEGFDDSVLVGVEAAAGAGVLVVFVSEDLDESDEPDVASDAVAVAGVVEDDPPRLSFL
jgi:hypothetical protein